MLNNRKNRIVKRILFKHDMKISNRVQIFLFHRKFQGAPLYKIYSSRKMSKTSFTPIMKTSVILDRF